MPMRDSMCSKMEPSLRHQKIMKEMLEKTRMRKENNKISVVNRVTNFRSIANSKIN